MYDAKDQRLLFDLSKELLNAATSETPEAAKDQSTGLRKVLVFHEWKYSIKNDPVISDFEYDQLYKKLEALEKAFPNLIVPDSPTQRVSNDLIEDFKLVDHLVPMLSLDNSYNAEDLRDFEDRVRKNTSIPEGTPIEYCVEPKYDGGSIALVYEGDQLVRAATRGNGVAGDEITLNARAMKSVPLKAAFSSKGLNKVELRGEVVIRKDIFDKMNEARAKEGETLFANPRNTATAGLRMKDPKEVAKRGLVAFLYQLGHGVNAEGKDNLKQFKTHDNGIELLGNLGFKVPVEERKVCKNIQEVIDFCKEWEAKRDSYEYEIDGMVVKVNDLRLQEISGYTSHHPRWAIAYKFKAKQATSKLLNVEYQVGKIGSITPVAKIEPVALAGVTVSSVSLHNEDFITSKDIRLGDTVLVERAGDVIPYIVKSMGDLRDGSEVVIKFPSNCPACDSVLVRSEKEAAWRCENYECKAQVLQRMISHVSKDAMDIDGFGKSYIERFHQLGWIKNIADIYRLNYDAIALLEGFGQRSADNLEAAIEVAKKNPIQRLLYSLTVHHLGRKVSKLLAQEIDHVMDLKDWTEENFVEIKDIGPKVAENVIVFFQNPANIELLETMEALGVNMKQTEEDRPKAVSADAPLVGKTILFTGKLLKMGRKQAQEMAEQAGAKNISAVSSNLNILVAGEKAGSKLKKAQALGTVEVMTEDEFLILIGRE
ncbi:MAG: DNA ligase (NAD+) [Nonlabens sp.]|jgi:DNA ligase (NAD+)